VKDVVITHMHYDHVGTFFDFPAARFHLQDAEMSYATGRYMRHARFNHGYEVDDVVGMVKLVFKDRVRFHTDRPSWRRASACITSADIRPGCSACGSRPRGWVVLASDTSHYYEHMETGRVFPTAFHVGEMVGRLRQASRLAESPKHIIPGHDPLVMERYPAPSTTLEGIAVRLDVPPFHDRASRPQICLA
jgi:glyoxylase-like metal-dependent hydrolase (beta-lactamase superfamily II)